MLATQSFGAFHNPAGAWLDHLLYLRSRFSPTIFPVTAAIHGISYQNHLWHYFARLVLSPTLPCDSVICTSQAAKTAFRNCVEYAADELRQSGVAWQETKLRLDVVPLGVDTEVFAPRDRTVCRRLLGLPLDELILLHFGRINFGSKSDTNPLLLAVKAFLQKHDTKLTVLFAGEATSNHVSELLDLARHLGLSQKVLVRACPPVVEAPLYYGAADIFISLSDTVQESFGLAPLEAMASGLPVIVSDWSGYRDTVVHGKTGFRVPTYWLPCDASIASLSPLRDWWTDHMLLAQSVIVDPEKLSEYLEALICHADLRKSMGGAAREHVVAHYRWETVIEQYADLWADLSGIATGIEPNAHKSLPVPCVKAEYYRNFSHFASRELKGSEALRVTPSGRELLKNKSSTYRHTELGAAINLQAVLLILRMVGWMTRFKLPATIQNITQLYSTKRSVPPDVTLRHIAWMLKYNLLHVESPTQ